MLALTTALFVLSNLASVGTSAERQIAIPCAVVADRASQYFDDHDLDARRSTQVNDINIDLTSHKDTSTPSGKPLQLNRFSVGKYTEPRHLSLMKTYSSFRLNGHLHLTKASETSCKLTLQFSISAYEWVWALAAIDDGYPSKFVSNGTLERLYIDAISSLFTTNTR